MFTAVEGMYNRVLTTHGHWTHFVHYRYTVCRYLLYSFMSLPFQKYVHLNHDVSVAAAWPTVRVAHVCYTHITSTTPARAMVMCYVVS